VARSILLRLTDIRDTIDGIQSLAAGVAFDTFNANWAMQRAVERGLEIISEACRHIPDEVKAAGRFGLHRREQTPRPFVQVTLNCREPFPNHRCVYHPQNLTSTSPSRHLP
jgi:hypothetical protein